MSKGNRTVWYRYLALGFFRRSRMAPISAPSISALPTTMQISSPLLPVAGNSYPPTLTNATWSSAVSVPSIVLPDDVEIAIEIGTSHGTDIDGAEATFDGDTSVKLNAGDRVVIHRSSREALMIKTKNTSFLEILREKMSR